MGLERQPTTALMMTQELLANLLGVRREGVTAAALKLQQAGVIRYSRGRIDVLDRARLQQFSGTSVNVRQQTYMPARSADHGPALAQELLAA